MGTATPTPTTCSTLSIPRAGGPRRNADPTRMKGVKRPEILVYYIVGCQCVCHKFGQTCPFSVMIIISYMAGWCVIPLLWPIEHQGTPRKALLHWQWKCFFLLLATHRTFAKCMEVDSRYLTTIMRRSDYSYSSSYHLPLDAPPGAVTLMLPRAEGPRQRSS